LLFYLTENYIIMLDYESMMINMKKQYKLNSLLKLNQATVTRLNNLGIHSGSKIKVVRFYPFHGPVIIENNHQRIGIRYSVFKILTSGEENG